MDDDLPGADLGDRRGIEKRGEIVDAVEFVGETGNTVCEFQLYVKRVREIEGAADEDLGCGEAEVVVDDVYCGPEGEVLEGAKSKVRDFLD